METQQATPSLPRDPKNTLIIAILITSVVAGGGAYGLGRFMGEKEERRSGLTIDLLRKEVADLKTQSVEKIPPKEITKENTPICPTGEPGVVPTCPAGANVVLPQVFFKDKTQFSASDIANIQEKVIDPFVAYQQKNGRHVVSITIEKTKASGYDIALDAIIARDNSSTDPVSEGFLYKKEGSTYPLWKPEEVPPGYQG